MASFIEAVQPLVALLTRRERWRAAGLVLLAVLGAVAEALGIGAVFPFLSLLANPQILQTQPKLQVLLVWSGAHSTAQFLLLAAVALLLLYVLKNAFLALIYHVQTRFVFDLEHRLGTDLLTAYLNVPFGRGLERNSAERMHMVNAEVPRVTSHFLLPLLTLLTEGFIVLGIATLLVLWQPLAATVVLAAAGVVGLAFHGAFERRVSAYRNERARTHVQMFRWTQQSLGAMKEARVLGRVDYFADRFAASSRDYTRATQGFNFLNLLPRLGVETVAVGALLIAVAATIWTGRPLDEAVPILILFGLATVRIMPSVTRILSSINSVRFFLPAVEAVARDFTSLPQPAQQQAVGTRGAGRGRIRLERLMLRDVSYRYPGADRWALDAINLGIAGGEMLAIVGRSGAGKTTLGDLLLGLLEPIQGEIRVNDLRVASLGSEGGPISGLVPQHFFLLDDTVRRNVAFGLRDENVDNERVWNALRAARLESKVRQLPAGIESRVGEQGFTLSGGERQRLSIARALYDEPDILVLDEATSALDSTTEFEIVETLRALAGRMTLIIITHREAVAASCNRVLLMNEGRITAEGAFQQLTEREPGFRQIIQSLA